MSKADSESSTTNVGELLNWRLTPTGEESILRRGRPDESEESSTTTVGELLKTQAFRRRKWSSTRATFGGGIRHTTSTLHPPYPKGYPSCHCPHSEATRGNRPGSNECRKHSRPDRRTWPVTQAERKRRRRTRPLASTQRNNGGAHQNLIRETPTATPGGVTQHKLLSP